MKVVNLTFSVFGELTKRRGGIKRRRKTTIGRI
jgi:hypothetical protein